MRFPSPLQERGALRAPKTPTMQRFRLHHWVSCFQVEHECPLSTHRNHSLPALAGTHLNVRYRPKADVGASASPQGS